MEFNVDPYYDDFEKNARDNNYVKILFKPGTSVQARELTQLQSILQNQIKSFGDHIFQDGSPVVGGNLSLDNRASYIKLDDTFNNEDIDLNAFVGKLILRDPDGVVQAKVMAATSPAGGSPTLMVKYISGSEFVSGDVFRIAGDSTKAKCLDTDFTGKGTIVSINEGIFYVDGYFIKVLEQTAVASAYTQYANVKIGLEISDDIVDYVVDSTLLDPAQGSFNYQAPGADRYQFNLSLTTRPLDVAVDESKFFELMRVENGSITKHVRYPIYSEIEKTLARRTFDESGDYTVVPFRASVSQSSNTENYQLTVEPGKAYVKGFEFETLGTFKIEAPKPRGPLDKRTLTGIDIDTTYGNYLKFKDFYGSQQTIGTTFAAIDTDALEKIDFHICAADDADPTDHITYANTKIGTARVRAVQRDTANIAGGANDSEQSVYNVYFSELKMQPKIFKVGTVSGFESNKIEFPSGFPNTDNLYANATITVLPIKLTSVTGATNANVFTNSTRVNANTSGAAASGFTSELSIGDLIRVGDETKQIVYIDTGGAYLRVNSAFNFTYAPTSGTANDNLTIFKQEAYTSSIINQTRKIVSYNIAAERVAVLDSAFDEGAVPDNQTVVQLTYGVKDIESFVRSNAEVTLASAASGAAKIYSKGDISVQSRLSNGDVELFDQRDNLMIFKLPKNYIGRSQTVSPSLQSVTYQRIEHFIASVTGSPGSKTVEINLTGSKSFPWTATQTSIENNLVVMTRNDSSVGAGYPRGTILRIEPADISFNIDKTTLTINMTSAGWDEDIGAVDVYAIVEIENAGDSSAIRTKTYRSYDYLTDPWNYPVITDVTSDYGAGETEVVTLTNVGEVAQINVQYGLIHITNPDYTRIYPGDSISLFTPDVVKVRKIYAGNTTSGPDADNYQDITNHFYVDYGQTDEIYDHAKIILKQGYPTPNARLLIHTDLFEHGQTGGTFFSIDSYSSTVDNAGLTPYYYSSKFGGFNLRDCLDFRAVKPLGSVDDSLNPGLFSGPDSATEVTFSYFLPRIDKLVLSKSKEFRIIQGTSSAKPSPPDDDADSMTLYTIFLPPYVNNENDIRLKFHENKRYTMRDIGQIDKRVDRIEYYTALSNIENKAFDDMSQYEDGTEKEKYGIIGENFRNFNIADYRNPDFNCSMVRNSLTPFFKNKINGLKMISSYNVLENDKTISLDYDEVPAVVQGLASQRTVETTTTTTTLIAQEPKVVTIQPFLFGNFIGQLRLAPDIDYWIATELKPEVIRTPEYTTAPTDVVKEVTQTEVIVERVRNREVRITVPAPAINNSPAIIEVPATDPPAVIEAEKRKEFVEPNPPPVIVDDRMAPSESALSADPEPYEEEQRGFVPDIISPRVLPAAVEPDSPPFEVPPPDPDVPASIKTRPIVASKPRVPAGSSDSGGCVVLESYVPVISENHINNKPVLQAYQLVANHKIMLGEIAGENVMPSLGNVKSVYIDWQPCYRIKTEFGASLVCSSTAPIPTLLNGNLNPKALMGEAVPVMRKNQVTWEKIVEVVDVGYMFVKVIDAHDNYFWAGESDEAFILHHNVTSYSDKFSYDKN